MATNKKPDESDLSANVRPDALICGIVMPISAMADYSASHWSDVLDILNSAINDAGFSANLVSDADEVGVIHKRIVQNLYDNPIVICDVSGKNPNVMFELGLRLAFDKPTIIVKDNITNYSFDTSPVEHLSYPRDLRFSSIVDFKQKLSSKIKATHSAAADQSFSTFLKHFGSFKIPTLNKEEVSGQEFILEEIKALRFAVDRIARRGFRFEPRRSPISVTDNEINACMKGSSSKEISGLAAAIGTHPSVGEVKVDELSPGHSHLIVKGKPGGDLSAVRRFLENEKYSHEGDR